MILTLSLTRINKRKHDNWRWKTLVCQYCISYTITVLTLKAPHFGFAFFLKTISLHQWLQQRECEKLKTRNIPQEISEETNNHS